jgi:hypothetical protein
MTLAAILANGARAEDAPAGEALRPMCADRPGKATPPCIVDAGHFQLEVGVYDWASRSPAQDQTVQTIGAFEARLGLTAGTEVELSFTPVSISRTEGARQTGIGDVSFGGRVALTSPDTSGVSVSVEPFVLAPTGTHGQGAGQWGGGILLPVSIPAKTLTIGFTPQIQAAPAADGPGVRTQLSAALGASYPLGELSLGAELWGAAQPAVRGSEQASADFVAAWSPSRLHDVQFDAGLYAGLTRQTPRMELSFGVAHRF